MTPLAPRPALPDDAVLSLALGAIAAIGRLDALLSRDAPARPDARSPTGTAGEPDALVAAALGLVSLTGQLRAVLERAAEPAAAAPPTPRPASPASPREVLR